MTYMRFFLIFLFVLSGTSFGSCDDDVRDRDLESDADADSDSDGDSDSDTDTGPSGPIEQDCSDCPAVGITMDNMLCAIDICSTDLVVSNTYASPTTSPVDGTYEAVEHFGDGSNDLAPKLNGSYALMATGPATGTEHSEDIGGNPGTDPYANDQYADEPTHNEMEWTLDLIAPEQAHGFSFKYVFFSEEYDEYISTQFNDKLYVFIEAASTNGGEKSILNFTDCRDPDGYYDFICAAGQTGCNEGEKYCYIAINSALSDCCWYNGCPDPQTPTDITGTGYECAMDQMSDGSATGSSTGWLMTSWPINPGETFTLTFHIHDTGDGVLDSEVLLDSFQFLYDFTIPETSPIE